MRHGEADWPLVTERGLRGHALDLAPLTSRGEQQILDRCSGLKTHHFAYVLSSPMTRALQSATIAARFFDLPVRVEVGLHEWLPDLTYQWQESEQVERPLQFMRQGNEPEDYPGPPFERSADLAARVRAVLERHVGLGTVLVVTHGVAIWSVTGHHLELGETAWFPPSDGSGPAAG
jgi:broad specificity phosphatase PhoE